MRLTDGIAAAVVALCVVAVWEPEDCWGDYKGGTTDSKHYKAHKQWGHTINIYKMAMVPK